jgi:YYY domain-containing protein
MECSTAGGRLRILKTEGPTYAVECLLVCLIFLGILLRFQGHKWDDGAFLHPDEYGLANTISQLTVPASIGSYFNTRLSTLSPYQKYDADGRVTAPGPDNRMRWGQWPITIIRWTAEKTGNTEYRNLIQTGRRLSALADTATVCLLFLIALQLYGRRVALLAGALCSLAVMQIQQSHFMTVDNWGVLFSTAAVCCAVQVGRLAGNRRPQLWRWSVAFGLSTGMAAAARINLIPVFGLMLIASIIAGRRSRRGLDSESRPAVVVWLFWILLAAVSALAAFRVTQPMSFRAAAGDTGIFTVKLNPDWTESMELAASESNLESGGPPSEQWTGRIRLLFPWINMVIWGLGAPLGFTAFLGLIFILHRALSGRDWETHLLPLTWAGGYFLFMGTRRVMAMRYFLPIYPFLVLMAAYLLVELWRNSGDSPKFLGTRMHLSLPRFLRRTLAGSAAALIVGGTLLWAWGFTGIYRNPNTRIRASRWLYANVPAPGSVLANESWDESLPVRLNGRDPFGGLYRGITLEMRWPDTESKRKMLLDGLAEADYVILPSQRALWSISRLPNSYPMTMEYYRALFDGRLGFELAAEFSQPISIGPLRISDLTGRAGWKRSPPVPALRGNPFNDSLLAAEEAFSVYDHAPVWIFRKGSGFSPEKARNLLAAVDLGSVVAQSPRQATVAPTALMLPAGRLLEQRAGGTWSDMFDRGAPLNRYPLLAVLVWAGSLLVLGWLAFPLVWLGFRGLSDRGFPLAKLVALLFLAWATWMLASLRLLPFDRLAILLAVLCMAALSALVLFRHCSAIFSYLSQNRKYMLAMEALFLLLFGLDLLIRLGNPDLWHPVFGGEKPMAFSYFNAVLKSSSFPPYDPWLAGGYINYYYFGYVISAQLVKLLGIIPSSAYNLLVPTMFALFGSGVFCIAYNLVRAGNDGACAPGLRKFASRGSEYGNNAPREYVAASYPAPAVNPGKPVTAYFAGLASVVMVLILGNLGQAKMIATALLRVAGQAGGNLDWGIASKGIVRFLTTGFPLTPGNWYWDATRVIAGSTGGNEINEFPFFTFLYGDLHAHMLDMPVMALVLAWALTALLRKRGEEGFPGAPLFWFTGALVLGATRITNMWDFPTCFAICCAGVAGGQLWHAPRVTLAVFRKIGLHLMTLSALAFLLYLPFDQWFASPYSSLELWRGAKTPLQPFLLCHGLFLFIVFPLLAGETARWIKDVRKTSPPASGGHTGQFAFGAAAFVSWTCTLMVVTVYPVKVVILLAAWCGLLLLRSRSRLGLVERIFIFLTALALLLILVAEWFAVGGDRMNTLFKFYLQVWLLFGIAAGPVLARIWSEKGAWRPLRRRCWLTGFYLLVAMAALYPATAVFAKIHDRFQPAGSGDGRASGCVPIPGVPVPAAAPGGSGPSHGLDGMDYMQHASYCDNGYAIPLAYDYEAIRWMQANITGSPVILEAQSPNLYRLSSRYAWNTGLPDVVGWDWHQRQQRAALDTRFITGRGQEIERFYSHASIEGAVAFLRKYQVSYIVVGPLEKAYYLSSGGLGKMDAMAARGFLQEVHRNPGVSIFRVTGVE